jgi:arylsulfatase A-like enzyme
MTTSYRSGFDAIENEDGRRNVVLVTIDSLRADHCGFLGSEYDLTPTLDRMAADGLAFETAIAPGPRTPSSMPVAFTGRFDRQRDVSWGDWRDRWGRIAAHLGRHRTIAERLRADGYTTVGVTVNPWTHGTGFETGFDRLLELEGAEAIEGSDTGTTAFRALDWTLGRTELGDRYQWGNARDWFVQWPQYYDRVLELVREASAPYFLWVFLLDPHQPYLAPREYRTEASAPAMYYANIRERTTGAPDELPARLWTWLERSYRDAIRSTDAFLETLQTDLAEDDPAFVVHGDHGEAFGEHGSYGHEPYLYDENVHVPLVVGNVDPGRVTAPYSLRHLPRLLTGIATGANVPEAEWYAVARSDRTRQRAVRTGSCTYLQNGRETVLDTDGEERRSETALEAIEPLREIAEGVAEATDERQRLRDAAREVSR